jgi:hypothetical protein
MRRVLVPLDGSSLSASILPDAKQLAGEGGELILIRDPIGSDSESSLLGLNEEASVQETMSGPKQARAESIRRADCSLITNYAQTVRGHIPARFVYGGRKEARTPGTRTFSAP